jgi:hypothetical protein
VEGSPALFCLCGKQLNYTTNQSNRQSTMALEEISEKGIQAQLHDKYSLRWPQLPLEVEVESRYRSIPEGLVRDTRFLVRSDWVQLAEGYVRTRKHSDDITITLQKAADEQSLECTGADINYNAFRHQLLGGLCHIGTLLHMADRGRSIYFEIEDETWLDTMEVDAAYYALKPVSREAWVKR